MNDSEQQIIWEFIRGDLPIPTFESWLYTKRDLENVIGEEFYHKVISTNFKSSSDLYILKEKFEEFMRQKFPLSCECLTLANITIIDMGPEQSERVFATLQEVKIYGEDRWWLDLSQCKNCEQYWLVAQESRQNDIYCLKRLAKPEAEKIIQNNQWPECFVTLEELLAIGRDNGHSVRFADPLDSSLAYSIEDLLKNRPDISIAEMSSLLNIDGSTVIQILDKISKTNKTTNKDKN